MNSTIFFVSKGSTLKANGYTLMNPTREGYDFKGWSTSETGNGEIKTTKAVFQEEHSDNTIYYAQWEKKEDENEY